MCGYCDIQAYRKIIFGYKNDVNYKLRTYVRLKGITTTNSGVQMTNRTKLPPYRSQIAGVN
jgi:hypothetical protein